MQQPRHDAGVGRADEMDPLFDNRWSEKNTQ
jgi:hypothetical protein